MMFERKIMSPFKMLLVFSLCFSFVFAVSLTGNDTKRSHRFPNLGQTQIVEKPRNVKVLILGAGIAGITAANTLFGVDFKDFLVLEASDRIGGRLYKKNLQGGGVVELGANWVHGTINNPIWNLVQQANLNRVVTMSEPTEDKYIIVDENSNYANLQSQLEGKENMEKANKCLDKLVKIRKEKGEDDMSAREGLGQCDWIPQNVFDTSMEYFYYDFESAVPPENISCGVKLKSTDDNPYSIDSTLGDQVLISDKRGYETIVWNMAEKFIGQVKLNHKVTKITELDNTPLEVEVEVQDKDGMSLKQETVIANFVLVTFSIGVLQAQLGTMFQPSLPQEFQTSLEKIKMANYLKIFLQFNKRFWPSDYEYFFYASEKHGFYPVWQNLRTPGIPENENVLLVTVTGDKARELKENKEKIKEELVPVLINVFQSEVDPVPVLIHIELKNWELDPLFRGAYSNPVVGATSNDFNTLLEPVGKYAKRLFFAGEGLSELYYGYAHGSYLTGQRQAKEIHQKLKEFERSRENRLQMLEQNRAVGLNYLVRKTISKPENKTKY